MPDPALIDTAAPATPPPARGVGCYGKMPAVGDFVSRGLPGDFVGAWDGWLQRALPASELALGAQFDELYLTFPIWRFIAAPGLLGASGWWGVMLPSIDRVGRKFPLTLAQPTDWAQLRGAGLERIEAHLCALAELGLSALDALPLERFDELAAQVPATPSSGDETGIASRAQIDLGAFIVPGGTGSWALDSGVEAALCAAARQTVWRALLDRMLWWVAAEPEQPGVLRLVDFPLRDDLLAELIRAT